MAKGASLPMNTPVRRVMRFNVPTIEPTTPLAILAWKYMDHARDQAFPVVDNEQLVGIITAMEVDKIPRLEWGKYRVAEMMLPREKLIVFTPDDDLHAPMPHLHAARIHHAPPFESPLRS